jgi:histidyl-tRNA synthetase
MRDLLTEDMIRFREIETVFREVCQGWDYEEIRTPTVEHLHLFTSAGTLSPQMLGRVYSFLDWDGWSGERVVLRPDSTIPVARAYAERAQPGETWKRWYIQNVLRFASDDESREDWQCGIELIGGAQPSADIEIIQIASEILTSLGFEPQISVSDPSIMREVLSAANYDPAEQLEQYDRILDGNAEVLDEVAARIDGAGAALSAMLSMDGVGSAYIKNLQGTLQSLIPGVKEALAKLLSISEILEALGKSHVVAPVLARNFEYYTGPVFSMELNGLTVARGGRYDGLLALVGGLDVPACGFALEMDAIAAALPNAKEAHPHLAVRASSGDDQALAGAFALAAALRKQGLAFRMADTAGPMDEVEAVAESDGYTLRLNGGAPKAFRAASEVVAALIAEND